ncbi:MAG: hypothetical protein WCC12_18820 [Anaerolineales bacterium]
MTRTTLRLNFLALALTIFFLTPESILGLGNTGNAQPGFAEFRRLVQNGEANVLRGVYVEDVLALPVVQQPADEPYYVSNHEGETTQFSMPARYGNIGLLAHNTLSGKFFSQLVTGQEVRLVYGDGRVEYFVVKDILRFQALEPENVSSSFRNLDRQETLSAGQVFQRAYVGKRHLVFQTCIQANGNASWGRLFVVAKPRP